MSGSQTARVWTEDWVGNSLYCPNCGNESLNQFTANTPLADFFCSKCNDQFELKSQKKPFGRKVANGAYATKIKRLTSNSSPNLILMKYDSTVRRVEDICFVPRQFFVPSTIERRKPLKPTARRAGWIGSNILLSRIPDAGRIFAVKDGYIEPPEIVRKRWADSLFLRDQALSNRGWLIAVMNCIEALQSPSFSLEEIYAFEGDLQTQYPDNNNVRPKIRQQLQVLRDNGYLLFTGRGNYQLTDRR